MSGKVPEVDFAFIGLPAAQRPASTLPKVQYS